MNDAGRETMARVGEAGVHVSPAGLANRQRHADIHFAHVAQLALTDKPFDFLHRLIEAIVVILDDALSPRFSQRPKFEKLAMRRRNRLFDNDMSPGIQRIRHQAGVRARRRQYMYDIGPGLRQHLIRIGKCPLRPESRNGIFRQ